MLKTVCRYTIQLTGDTSIYRYLGTSYCVNHDTCTIIGINNLEFDVYLHWNFTKISSTHGDVTHFIVCKESHKVRRTNSHGYLVRSHGSYCTRLTDSLVLETFLIKHVIEIHISTNI